MSVNITDSILRQIQNENLHYISELRALGFKSSHPNDGWVDRKHNIITLSYPDFDDGCKVGDKVMLGWANDKDSQESIILTGIYINPFDITNNTKRFYFEKST